MTEVVVNSADQQNDNTAVQNASGGAGQLLRQAREQQQLSIQTMASTLKVPVYKLQALEEDRWDVLTDSVFTRSLALSVCRLLNIASEPVLAGLPKHEAAKLAANPEGINAPFKEKTLRSLMTSSQDSGSGNGVKVVAALLIAVAGGAGLYLLPQWQSGEDAELQVGGESAADEPLFMPQLQAATPSEVLAADMALAAVEQASEAASAAGSARIEAEPVSAPVAAAATPAAVAVSAPAAVPGLRFTANGESWVQVRDAQGAVVMEKILKAGDVYEEPVASRPLQVVVGNAGSTTLEIDGVALDVMASARNNVARFEVK